MTTKNLKRCRDYYGIQLKVGDYVKPIEGPIKLKTGYISDIYVSQEKNAYSCIDIVDERGSILLKKVNSNEFTKQIPIHKI